MHAPGIFLALTLCVTCTMVHSNKSLSTVSAATEYFATGFFKEVAKEKKENVVCSPLSAHVVLSMAALGAAGETAKVMRQSLGLPADDAVFREGMQSLIDKLNNVNNITLELANKMYVAKDLILKSEFKQLTAGNFRSEVSQLDFSKSDPSAKIVNKWVDEKTHHKIREIVKPEDITQNTRMILLNAIYFKGKWEKEFKKNDTKDEDFFLDAKTSKKVPTMFMVGKFMYGELPDLKAKFIELPYQNKDLKMVIIVPDEIEGLKSIVENLESFNSTRLAQSGRKKKVHLYLPKFKIESTIDLKNVLSKLGMGNIFSNQANFKGVSNESLTVGKIVQKAFIEVNEEGSEAAALTDGHIMFLSAKFQKPILDVNRPFIYQIVYGSTEVLLFSGQVLQPMNA